MASTQGQSPRGPAATNSVLAVVLVVLVAAVALVARQPAPPAIAEFAPQAQHQIKQAPLQQTSNVGAAAGSGIPGAKKKPPPPPKAAKPQVIDLPAVRQCYGNPPRQLSFDTQSPPCISYWTGNNGGATSKGVTGNQINVFITGNVNNDTLGMRVANDLKNFFDRNFEFYGRSLNIHYIDGNSVGSNSGNGPNCQFEYGAAHDYAVKYNLFASLDPNANAPGCFLIGMAKQKVIATSEYAYLTEQDMQQYSPYLYQYPMANDQELASTGDMICAELAGKTADFTKDPTLLGKPRVFGAFSHYGFSKDPPDLTPLKREMAKCGAKIVAEGSAGLTGGQGTANAGAQVESDTNNAMLKFRQAGVTTVICDCNIILAATVSAAADNQDYHPEWVVNTTGGADWDFYTKTFWGAQERQSLIGMTFEPDQVPYPSWTLNQALASVDPGFQVDGPWNYYLPLQDIYWEMLLLASGIQMAGPHLTPQTFQHGLQAAQFPNPLSAQVEGKAGFLGGTHSMTKDVALMWWNDAAPDPYPEGNNGAWCYVENGRRFSPYVFPKNLPLFSGPCTTTPPGS